MARATRARSVLDKVDRYRTFRSLEIVFYSTYRTGTEKNAVQTFRFHLARRRRMPAPAESKAVATVKLNKVEDVKESQPASQGHSFHPVASARSGFAHRAAHLEASAAGCVNGMWVRCRWDFNRV